MSLPSTDSAQTAEPISVDAIYATWRMDHEQGVGPSFDELCAHHAEQAAMLRDIHRHYEQLISILPEGSARPKTKGTSTGRSALPFTELLARLQRHKPAESRYVEGREIGRGGMGRLLECHDVDLRRTVAKKVILSAADKQGGASPSSPTVFGRFLEEAQVTAQLAHPGVVPVHEMGIDESGRLFFTMDLISGQTLAEIYARHRKGDAEWSLARVVGVLIRVCETVAYAHSREVLHRDLKPSNVMVGAFGEVYVMDWGLAKVLSSGEAPTASTSGVPRPRVSTDRRDESDRDVHAAVATQEGQGAGTIGYMSPEQALGRVKALTPRSDVYSLGAMLFELLAGSRPYEETHKREGIAGYVKALRDGMPLDLRRSAPTAPAELISITNKAMAHKAADRFATGKQLADDLRNWSEGRVVRAHEQGAWPELKKWVRRNRGLAATGGLAVLAVVAGTAGIAWLEHKGQEKVGHLKRVGQVEVAPSAIPGLIQTASEVWPSVPENIPQLDLWLKRAVDLNEQLPLYEAALDALEGRASEFRRDDFTQVSARDLVEPIRAIRSAELPFEWVRARVRIAESVLQLTETGPEARLRWDKARAAIKRSPVYGGLELPVQSDLLPLEADRDSGLWEFWHALSGAEPQRSPETGKWDITPETGIVLVLIPGGEYSTGVPDVDEKDPRRDVLFNSETDIAGSWSVKLSPFFISKYEMTQGQWRRVTNRTPSRHGNGNERHPVETVTWDECSTALHRFRLTFPTDAQWEAAGRGGQEWPMYTGPLTWDDYASIAGHAIFNPADGREPAPDLGEKGTRPDPAVWRFDWHSSTEPVGTLRANPFGLHDVHGNVYEWCRDEFDRDAVVKRQYRADPREGDGLRTAPNPTRKRVMRGGGYNSPHENIRFGHRHGWEAQNSEPDSGVRPARPVQGLQP